MIVVKVIQTSKMLSITYYIVAFLFSCTNALYTLSLNSDNINGSWSVTNENKSISVSSFVPGGIYTDLRESLVLTEDIYLRSNDELYRWVAHDNWTYSLNFSVPHDWNPELKEVIIFHGIDTVAWINLNDVLLHTKLDNMFVRHVLNVSGIIKYNGLENNLKVKLISPLWEVNERARLWPRVVPDCIPPAYHGECHANLLRKTQSSFSWDWGPAFPSMGIWKDAEFVTYNGAILRDVTVKMDRVSQNATNATSASFWRVSFTLHLEAFIPGDIIEGLGQVVLGLEDSSKKGAESDIVGMEKVYGVADENGYFKLTIHLNVPEEKVSLWWPNGLGSQPLYTVLATFEARGNGYTEKTFKEIRIGFRTIELVQEEIGRSGLSFYLKVNGIPVFAKGSNWIPPYSLPEWSETKNGKNMIKHLLFSAKEVGMNMLRVWGGGNYETDFFYMLADELGILIWQDMMFACSMYPVVPEFLNSTEIEVKQQVSRLQHHPSIAIWAGNNENEAALRQNWYGTSSNYSSYLHDYALLYGDVIRNAVLSIDPMAIFLTSSPSNGKESMSADGYVAKNPQSNLYGDIHYYNYLSNTWNPMVYPLPRFASEFGIQSMPSVEAFFDAGVGDDWGTNTDFFIRRQHHPGGYAELMYGVGNHFNLPTNMSSQEGMSKFILLTQIYQAMSLKVETEAYRRGKGKRVPLGNGEIEGMTMGALYWQLNDIWQAPSWSSIEFGGKWKMAHYFSKQFFSNILISPVVTLDNQLQIYIVSDVQFPCEGNVSNCFLIVRTYSWDKPCPTGVTSMELNMSRLPDEVAYTFDLEAYLQSSGCKGNDINALKKSCFLTFELKFLDGSHESSRNFILLSEPKDITNIKKANVKGVSFSELYPTKDPELRKHYPISRDYTMSSDAIVLFLWLEFRGVKVRYSDNGFLMAATEDDPMCRRGRSREFHAAKRNYEDRVPLKTGSSDMENTNCPYNCSDLDNSVRMAICCAEISEMDELERFNYTVTMYFYEEISNFSAFHENLLITHPFS